MAQHSIRYWVALDADVLVFEELVELGGGVNLHAVPDPPCSQQHSVDHVVVLLPVRLSAVEIARHLLALIELFAL